MTYMIALMNCTLLQNQWTPLHYASYNGHSEVIRILLRGYYADPYLRNEVSCIDKLVLIII